MVCPGGWVLTSSDAVQAVSPIPLLLLRLAVSLEPLAGLPNEPQRPPGAYRSVLAPLFQRVQFSLGRSRSFLTRRPRKNRSRLGRDASPVGEPNALRGPRQLHLLCSPFRLCMAISRQARRVHSFLLCTVRLSAKIVDPHCFQASPMFPSFEADRLN